MSKFHVLINCMLLVTSPSLLAYPQCEPPIGQQMYGQEKPFDGFSLTYDEILQLLQNIEEGRVEEYGDTDIDSIRQFVTSLAKSGMLPREYAANVELQTDIAALFTEEEKLYADYCANALDEYSMLPAAYLNGEQDAMIFLCKHKKHKHKCKHQHSHHDEHKRKKSLFAKINRFIKKHRKAIIIGAAVIVGAAIVIIALTAAPALGAVAGAAAAGAGASPGSNDKSDNNEPEPNFPESLGSGNSPPIVGLALDASTLQSMIDNQIFIFKENIDQNQFFKPMNFQPGYLSWEENGRTLGSMFAHDSYNSIQSEITYYPKLSHEIQGVHLEDDFAVPAKNQMMGHTEIDRKFSTDYSYLYFGSGPAIDFTSLSHQVLGETALSLGYYDQAVQNLSNAIENNPTNSILYLERGISNFNRGEYDHSIEDYRQYASQAHAQTNVQQIDLASVLEFSRGAAVGFRNGAFESVKGQARFVVDLLTDPIHTAEHMWDAVNSLRSLIQTEGWNYIKEYVVSEVHQLLDEWDTLPIDKRGELVGYAFGKYGADIFTPGAVTKVVSKGLKGAKEFSAVYQRLQNAEKTLVLESVSSIENGAIIAESIQIRTANIAEKLGFNAQEIAQLKNIGKLEEAIDSIGKNITNATTTQDINFTNHALQRAIERNMSKESILDALVSPLKVEEVKIDKLGRPSQRLIGQKAEVVINPDTQQIISVNPTSTKKYQKLNKEINNVES